VNSGRLTKTIKCGIDLFQAEIMHSNHGGFLKEFNQINSQLLFILQKIKTDHVHINHNSCVRISPLPCLRLVKINLNDHYLDKKSQY